MPEEPFVPGLYTAELLSGEFIDLDCPDPRTIAFDDIAGSLSKLCRYNGQCSRFYTVAEHAVLVARRLEDQGHDPDVCLAGLHHDDAEAITGDISRPVKKKVPEFKKLEAVVFAAVTEALGISHLPFEDPVVKEADEWALQREAYELMPSRGVHWYAALKHPGGPAPWRLGWEPAAAQRRWIQSHVKFRRLGA